MSTFMLLGAGTTLKAVAAGPVSFVAASAEQNASAGVVNTTTLTTDIGSSPNALVAMISFNAAVTGLSVVWDGQTMSQIGSTFVSADGYQGLFYGLINPNYGGSKNLVLNWTTNRNVSVATVSLSGANSTFGTAFGLQTNSATAAASPATITVNSASTHYTVAQVLMNQSLQTGQNNTLIFRDNGLTQGVGAHRAAGDTTVSYSWNYTGSGNWIYGAVDVSP